MLGSDFSISVVEKLRDAGFQALWAGGCVRDQLLGRIPKDYDVATSATPEQVRELFGRRRTVAVGAAFGVIAVLGPRNAVPVEVVTFREDGRYTDGRHPDSVRFSSAETDAQRRDFTINGIFYDPIAERVIDYVGGKADLHSGIVRAIGNADDRFAEDKLRMLRAVRFATVYNFEIEQQTFESIIAQSAEITVVSAERIADELRKMLVHPARSEAVGLLSRTGLLRHVFPKLRCLEEDEELLRRTQRRLRALGDGPVSFPMALSALFLEAIGNSKSAEQLGSRLRLSNAERRRCGWILANVSNLLEADKLPWPKLQRLLIQDGARELVALGRAESLASSSGFEALKLVDEKMKLPPEELNPAKLLAGDDLTRLGYTPGPRFRDALTAIRDAQLMGKLSTTDQAVDFAKSFFESGD